MSVHNAAKKGAIASTVLLPGDPLRAKFIAENFLTDVTCYNEVRNMLGFTGLYKGSRVSVQGTGMGMPSISIYAQELMEDYGVENLIRIGTCGTFLDEVNIRDVVLAQGASTDSGMNRLRFQGQDFAPVADFHLLKKAYEYGEKNGFTMKVGNVLSSDYFYNEPLLGDVYQIWAAYGILAVEMEAAALYTLAARFRRKALAIMTVTDHLIREERISPEDRQTSLTHMIEMALSLA